MDLRLPDFICVGTQKSGTTWLYHELSKHPDIDMPKTKEVGNNNASTGVEKNKHGISSPFLNLEKYSSYFPKNNKITGDITPLYFYEPDCAKQIKKVLPNSFVFVILRNPVDRAFSQWRMVRNLGAMEKTATFMKCFEENVRNIKTRCLYINYIRSFIDELGENFKFYFYDDILKNPNYFLKNILKNINVNLEFNFSSSWLKMPYHDDNQIIKKEDKKRCMSFYYSSIKELEKLVHVNTEWTYEKIL